ncbi:MAG: trigger factor [Bryobacterales bacterium]|nr:trigger factor [Bryobacteraceae bacterium]MDW8129783.1 trigger factor [Bryobacterales bacterium]
MADPSEIRKKLEIAVPAAEVSEAAERAVAGLQKKVHLRGFRPGKAPASLIQRLYADEIRREVLNELVPKYLFQRAEQEGFVIVGSPEIRDVHFQPGEPLRFTAEFEIQPEIELADYKGIPIAYQEPEVTDEDVARRLEQLRREKAELVTVEPRPLAAGDFALVAIESLAGADPPIRQEDLSLEIAGEDTLPAFTENLLGLSPGEEKEFDVHYPEDYGQRRLAGKTVRFRVRVKAVRRRELPELNDEFARDLGDYMNLEELREAVRRSLLVERQLEARREAEQRLVDKLIQMHDFPVPQAYVERQLELEAARSMQLMESQGLDPARLDWQKFAETRRDRVLRDVKASLILEKIADREGIYATQDEVDREVQRIARQERQPVAAVRMRLEKQDGLRRIAHRIRTQKTLDFLFEHATKRPVE